MRLVKARADVRAPRFALVVISAALVVSGCGIFGTSASGPGNSGSVTVGIVPGIDTTPLRVGIQDGLFRDQGLNVVVKSYSSLQPEFQALKSGSVDIAAGDYADFLYEAATGNASLHLLADGYDAAPSVMEVLALPGSGITTPQQLVHKVVATPEPQLIPSASGSYASDFVPFSMETLATESVLVSDGVTPTRVTWKPTPAQDMIRELRSGRVSAILATEPYIIEAESKLGAVEVMDSCSGLTANLPLSGYFSLGSYAGTHGSQLQRFQTALASAQADAANRGPLQAMLPRFTGMSTQDAALATLGSFPTSLITPQVQRVADLMYVSGVISNPLRVSSLASKLTTG
jgi:NitT/TauT family transport system substrate-binding protein